MVTLYLEITPVTSEGAGSSLFGTKTDCKKKAGNMKNKREQCIREIGSSGKCVYGTDGCVVHKKEKPCQPSADNAPSLPQEPTFYDPFETPPPEKS